MWTDLLKICRGETSLCRLLFVGVLTGLICLTDLSTVRAAPAMLADKASDDFNLGVGLYRGGRWQLAAETFGKFLQDFPDHERRSLARLYYGLSLSSLERYAEARPQFVAYIEAEGASPQAADARYRLGECSYYLKEYETAIVQLNEFLEKHAQHSLVDWASLFLGDSYIGLQQWDKAETVLKSLIAKPATATVLPDARFALARTAEALKKGDDAMLLYQQVAEDRKSPLAPRAMARIGTLYFNQQKYMEASDAYDQVVSQFPGTGIAFSAQLNSGLALFRSGQFLLAIERFKGIPADNANHAQATFMTAMCMKELGKIAEARQSFIAALESAGDSPIAADILFQRAQLERVEKQPKLAAQIFEDIADRWPEDRRVAECLFNAADLRLELADPESAERLWQRLERDFPAQAAQLREQVLLGRLRMSMKNGDAAIQVFQAALASPPEDSSARVLAVGRYYLLRSLYDADRHADVLIEAEKLKEALKDPAMQDLRSGLALAAVSGLQVKDFAASRKFADQFLPLASDENQKADVLAARTIALTQLGEFDLAYADAVLLTKSSAERNQTWSAILQAADAATKLQAFPQATRFFELAASNTADRAVQEAGMTGVAWSYFRSQKYIEAESAFKSLSMTFPESEDAPQAIYMQARSVEEQGDQAKAAASYQTVFSQLMGNTDAAPKEAEATPPLQYAFDAGRQAARMLGRLQQTDQADQQWEQLVRRFPDARDLDRILDEWATLNLNAERYERSDKIHQTLLQRFPDSMFAGMARLSLAESAMQAKQLDAALKEFESIVSEPKYGPSEKERALFHIVDIHTSGRNWQKVAEYADRFIKQYSGSPLSPQVRLLAAEAALNTAKEQSELAATMTQLTQLRDEIAAKSVPEEEWTERVWVVMAEAALALKDYTRIDVIADELTQRKPDSRFKFQIWDVQGRRWKNQAPPDFSKARDYFRRVIDDETGRGTETAARCQFLTAETLVMEQKYEEARREYLRLEIGHPYPVWQVQALYQTAGCEIQLGLKDDAKRSYEELISKFPESELAAKAKEKLQELGAR